MSDVDRAVELFRNGCACSQALLAAFGPRFGLDEALALRLASGFGSGMRMGDTCGAVTGAFMVLGLASCRASCRTADERQPACDAVASFAAEFRRRQAALACRDLLECDVSTPEGRAEARARNLFKTRCVDVVRTAAELLEGRLGSA